MHQEAGAFEASLARIERSCQRRVGADCTEGRETLAIPTAGAWKDVFELPYLVTTIGDAGQVVVFDRELAFSGVQVNLEGSSSLVRTKPIRGKSFTLSSNSV